MSDPLAHFKDKRIMVVEDGYFIADETRSRLEALGAAVVGPAPTVAEAVALLKWNRIDAAILDIRLADEMSYPIAEQLERLDIPFVFASACEMEMPACYKGYILCSRPGALTVIARALFARPGDH